MEIVIFVLVVLIIIGYLSSKSSNTGTKQVPLVKQHRKTNIQKDLTKLESQTNVESEFQRKTRLQNEHEEVERKIKTRIQLQQQQDAQRKQADIERERRQAELQRQAHQQEEREKAERKRLIAQQEIRRLAEQQQQELLTQQEQQRQLQFCEANTSYCELLEALYNNNRNISLERIRGISSSFINGLDDEEKGRLHAELNSGVAILKTNGHLHSYMYAYGKMHNAKLYQAFETCINHNHLNLNGKNLEIIDYGCGQGIGTIVFIDYLKNQSFTGYKITSVKLIEPSELALKRAALNVRYSLRSAGQSENVLAIHKDLDSITELDLATKTSSIKIHIFSNIIDVNGFNLQSLCNKISTSQKESNFFICVSPKLWENGVNPRNIRLDNFLHHFQDAHGATVLSNRETNIGTWKRYERVFKADLSTKSVLKSAVSQQNTANDFDDLDLPF